MIELTPATPSDMMETGGVLEFRARAVTARLNDKIVGVGGLGTLDCGEVIGFARLTPEFRRQKVSLCKVARKIMEEAKARGMKRVIATADPSEPAAERFLQWLGFKPAEINGRKLFVWTRP